MGMQFTAFSIMLSRTGQSLFTLRQYVMRPAKVFPHDLLTLNYGRFVINKTKDREDKPHKSLPSTNRMRNYHTTTRTERSGATIMLVLGALALTAKAGQYAVRAYDGWLVSTTQESTGCIDGKPQKDMDGGTTSMKKERSSSTQQKVHEETSANNKNASQSFNTKKEPPHSSKNDNVFEKLFGIDINSNYYEGGFEDKMTESEAALILGVRRSSTTRRIKEAHRRLLVINHPDTGGSTHVAGKINEAKDLLLKGRRDRL